MPERFDREARVFPVETRFQKVARRPGGIPRDQAIEKAWTEIEEIRPELDDWLNLELQNLADVIKGAQSGAAPSAWVEIANVHSRQLRDVGTTMGFELLTFVTDSLCEVLNAIVDGADCNMDSIVCHLDALVLVQQQPYRCLKPEQVPELTQGLRRVADHVSVSTANFAIEADRT